MVTQIPKFPLPSTEIETRNDISHVIRRLRAEKREFQRTHHFFNDQYIPFLHFSSKITFIFVNFCEYYKCSKNFYSKP